jgi:hypothetical protein
MKMLVIGSCTKSKHASECSKHLRLSSNDLEDPLRLRVREQELAKWLRAAGEMYIGRQHTQMMDSVRLVRSVFGSDACDVAIISAGMDFSRSKRELLHMASPFMERARRSSKQEEKGWGYAGEISTHTR